MARDPYKYFRIEARELLDQLGKGVLDLERESPGADLVARLLRLAHTLKGAARVVKQREIADLAHSVEGALAPFRDGTNLPQAEADHVLKMLDAMERHLIALAAPASVPAPAAASEVPEAPAGGAFALHSADGAAAGQPADMDEVDTLLDGVAEAQVQLAALGRTGRTAERIRHLADLLTVPVASPHLPGLSAARMSRTAAAVEELRSLAGSLERGVPAGVEQVHRELRQVRENAERLRLVPARRMFTSLERAARDSAQSLGRQVAVETQGGEIRLDAHVLGVVQSALLQAVRNAVAHGIEGPAERVALGKAPAGRIALIVCRRGSRVVFVCRDDGRGIDLEAVRRAAERKGVAFSGAAQEEIGSLLRLLLQGGISTARTVTEASGRGIGLDVVREAADRLGGETSVQTEPGRGTTLEIVVPVTLASLEVLVVEAEGQIAAIPLDAVRRTLRVGMPDVMQAAGGTGILFDGTLIPFAPLSRSLRSKGPAASAGRAWSAVVVEGGGGLAALGVDRMLGTETTVVRPLPALAHLDPVVSGASLDLEGNPQIVLDPEQLVLAAQGRGKSEPETPATPPILVVDDSMTTRMLEQSILESAGYEVDVAASGEEALKKARERRFALFLVDVEMPGMDGFAFIEQSRADPALRDVPAILVTSRASPEDKQRGAAVGARAYIVKSEFDQTDLLDRIFKLVG